MPKGTMYFPIATNTLGSDASSVTFSNVPQIYTDLILVGKMIENSGGNNNGRMRFNSDSGTNYSGTGLVGDSNGASSYRGTSTTGLGLSYGNANNGRVPEFIYHIMNYANTTTYKTAINRNGQGSSSGWAGMDVGVWRSTSAISTVSFHTTNTDFGTGSTFTLYGVLAAQETLMANVMTLLQKITIGSAGAADIEFTNIPQNYTDLLIRLSARASADTVQASVSFNGSTSNRGNMMVYGSGAGSGSETTSSMYSYGSIATSAATASTFSNVQYHIPNYAGSTNKSMLIDSVNENNATTAYASLVASLWSNTAAITSVKITSGLGNFVQYTTAYLYGISKEGNFPAPTSAPYAIGGDTITYDGTYWYHTFRSSGTFTPKRNLTCDYLVVAGGGGASGGIGAGGGAGGLRSTVTATGGGGSLESPVSLSLNNIYTITVGAGGAKNTARYLTGSQGGNSSISGTGLTTITSTGGGGGGGGVNNPPSSGGSGGGHAGLGNGAAGTTNQGYAGGNGLDGTVSFTACGGGGGAGAVGSNGTGSPSSGGNGGAGVAVAITGSSVTYAGGGGGAGDSNFGTGGSGGGGNAGGSSGSDGTANLGGGGGGCGQTGATFFGGNGGSGIVIVRYAA